MTGVELATAYLNLAVQDSDITPGVRKALVGVEKDATRTGRTAGRNLGSGLKTGVGGAMKSIAGGFLGMFAAVGVKNLIGGALGEARESQKVGALTAQIIKSTGGAAKITAAQVGDLATALSNKTGVDDEAIQAGANLLLTFKNVRNEAGAGAAIFDRATAAAGDLSAAGFGSITGASKMLGKALNDPVKGMSAMSRAGVTFTDAQKKQVKALVETGDVLGAQKIILKEVESQVGGAAAATATSADRAAVAAGNLKETIGTAMLPIVDRMADTFSSKIAPAITGFVKGMQDGTGAGGTFAGVLGTVGDVIGTVVGFLQRWSDVLVPVGAGIGAVVVAMRAWSIATGIVTVAQGLLNVALTANPIGLVILAIVGLGTALVVAWKKSETFRRIVTAAFDIIKIAVLKMALVAVTAFGFIVNAFFSLAEKIIGTAAKAFGWVPGLGPKLKTAAAKITEFKDNANGALDRIKTNLKVSLATAQAEQAARRLASQLTTILRDRTMTMTGTVIVHGVRYNSGQFASGGLVRGPGTSTSDSILARLSDREYVVRAAAVDHYGTDFLDRLNAKRLASGGPVSSRVTQSGASDGGADIRAALEGVIVQMDGHTVGRLVTRYQSGRAYA